MLILSRVQATFLRASPVKLLRPKFPVQICRSCLNNHQAKHERPIHTINKLEALKPAHGLTNLIIKRFKKKKAGQLKGSENEEEDDDDDEDLSGENPLLVDDLLNPVSDGGELITIDCSSLRLDSFCRAAFSTSRVKIEESFYKGDIYINGVRPAKKSTEVGAGDELDFVKYISPEDSNMVVVNRALIVHLPDKTTETGRMKLQIKRWLNLTIKAHSDKKNED